MLVLSRKIGEKIAIGDDISIIVQRISRSRVSLAIEAPDHVRIIRGELEPIVRDFDRPEHPGSVLFG
jgi:carbon storage regulator